MWLGRFRSWVEPEALAWLRRKVDARPGLAPADARRAVAGARRNGLKPYGYQLEGAAFLVASGRALLADEMGLGKTVQAILAAAALRRAPRPARSVTIVCPASLRGGWQDEIRRWVGEEAVLLEGRTAVRGETIRRRPAWLVSPCPVSRQRGEIQQKALQARAIAGADFDSRARAGARARAREAAPDLSDAA